MFGDLNDPNSEVSIALQNAKSVTRLDYEKNGIDTDPNIYYLNLAETDAILSSDPFRQVKQTVLPRDPNYTIAEEGWKKVAIPLMAVAMGATFLTQAFFFTKQLLEGEKDYEE
jgi:hypothetical protein